MKNGNCKDEFLIQFKCASRNVIHVQHKFFEKQTVLHMTEIHCKGHIKTDCFAISQSIKEISFWTCRSQLLRISQWILSVSHMLIAPYSPSEKIPASHWLRELIPGNSHLLSENTFVFLTWCAWEGYTEIAPKLTFNIRVQEWWLVALIYCTQCFTYINWQYDGWY